MSDPPPTTVLLPAVEWTTACAEVLEQLRPEDELLLIADDDSDPIAGRADSLPENARILFAGDPDGCSGKANAIALGMAEASADRLVWTDDDFHHPDGWLSQLHDDYAEHGPVSELPFFVGRDPLSLLLEPAYAISGTLGVYVDEKLWGGAVLFERDDLDEEAFLRDLRRTVSDDGTLAEYLDVTPLRRVRRVLVGGTIRETLERHVRFHEIVLKHSPRDMTISSVVMLFVAVACLVFPLYAIPLATLASATVYAMFGVRRWTALLAYPSILAGPLLLAYVLARQTFVWGGRRYRWNSMFDVEILE
jgi:glycosyltransferase involved in cell wall biosynthesis